MNPVRQISQVVQGLSAEDGAGVQLSRVIGQRALMQLDPFLLLDDFRSDDPQDYIAGFPPHPHRGFETVTYLMAGRMRHKDSAGHEGVIEPGGVQWMTAGRGIVHSEMPEQENGLLAGLQLWVNLPAAHKMDEPAYQEYKPGEVPLEHRATGVDLRVIAGTTSVGTKGPVEQQLTEPLYLDVELASENTFEEPLRETHNAFVYVLEGALQLPSGFAGRQHLTQGNLAVLTSGERVSLRAGKHGARFVLVAGKPLNEPVARGGPFVMNTEEQVEQAFTDYRSGNLS